jgi:hypothetical protein
MQEKVLLTLIRINDLQLRVRYEVLMAVRVRSV